MLDQACEISDWIKTRLMKNGFNAVWIGKKALHLPQTDLGPVCFRFFGSHFSENLDSEISQLPEESAV